MPFARWKGGLYATGTNLTKGRALIAVTAEGTQRIKVFDLAQKEIGSFFAHDRRCPAGANRLGRYERRRRAQLTDRQRAEQRDDGGESLQREEPRSDLRSFRYWTTSIAVVGSSRRRTFQVMGRRIRSSGWTAVRFRWCAIFDPKGKPLAEWLAYDEKFRGGVRVAVTDRNHVVVGPEIRREKTWPVRIFNTGRLKQQPIEFSPFIGFDGGLNVGGK